MSTSHQLHGTGTGQYQYGDSRSSQSMCELLDGFISSETDQWRKLFLLISKNDAHLGFDTAEFCLQFLDDFISLVRVKMYTIYIYTSSSRQYN